MCQTVLPLLMIAPVTSGGAIRASERNGRGHQASWLPGILSCAAAPQVVATWRAEMDVVLAVLVLISWAALRPPSRTLGILFPRAPFHRKKEA